MGEEGDSDTDFGTGMLIRFCGVSRHRFVTITNRVALG